MPGLLASAVTSRDPPRIGASCSGDEAPRLPAASAFRAAFFAVRARLRGRTLDAERLET
jgi:hypothetical protein